MGLLIKEEAIEHVRKIAERERAPMYVVGETTGDHRFAFQQADGVRPFDLHVEQNVRFFSQDIYGRQNRGTSLRNAEIRIV